MKAIESEFSLYSYHARPINGKSNYGWQRNQLHSAIQQIIRMDPFYYCLYVGFRPDHNWRLMSYPYYTKSTKPGDNTSFFHLDVNGSGLVCTGRGANLIQGTVSLDDEDEKNCTVMALGMHHHFEEWWASESATGKGTNDFVHWITQNMLTEEQKSKWNMKWSPCPAKRGQARISLPHIPHGCIGPATAIRRTVLPWFIAIQDDMSTLEMLDSGTAEMLAQSHRNRTAPDATSSGLANRYGAPPYAFSASVQVDSITTLGDTPLGRRP